MSHVVHRKLPLDIFYEAIYVVGAFALCVSLYVNLMQIRIIREVKHQTILLTKNACDKPKVINNNKLFTMANQLETAVKGLATSNYWTQNHEQCPSLYRTKLRNELGQVRNLLHTLRHFQFNNTECDAAIDDITAQTSVTFENNTLDLSSVQKALFEFADFHHCKLSISLSEKCILLMPNSTFCKVLKELVVNAVVHNDEHTNILVYGGVCENNLVINILDNGRGMPLAQLNDIWFKVENACALHRRSADTYVFTDLPAAICTIKSFGGDVEINTALEYGTNVRVFVPLKDKTSDDATDKCETDGSVNSNTKPLENVLQIAASAEKTSAFQQLHNPALLVINFSNSYVFKDTRASILPNHDVCLVETIDEAITMLSTRNVKLVLCDIDVEYDKALELSSLMMASPKIRDIPIVLLAFAIPQDLRIKLLRAGITNLLEKPVRIEEIMAISRACIDEVKAAENNVEEALATYTIEKSVVSASNVDNEFVDKFQNIIEQYYADQEFNRARCAALLFMSEKTLHRRIRTYFDSNFRSYLQKHRMVKAREILLSGESVTYTSLNVGIPSLSNFTRNFRLHFGYPPSKLSKRG